MNPELDPAKTLRSDLWPTMTLSELTRQQELVLDKLNKLSTLFGPSATPSIPNMYAALQIALQDLTKLIENRSQK